MSAASRFHGTPRGMAGYTLVELTIIIAILGIISGIEIPNLLSARESTNESFAGIILTANCVAQDDFKQIDSDEDGVADFARDLFELLSDGPPHPLDDFTIPTKSGYFFSMESNPSGDGWVGTAVPVKPGVTGARFFYTDETGVIRYSDGRRADDDDPEYPDPPPPPPPTKVPGGVEKAALRIIKALGRSGPGDPIGDAQAVLRDPTNVDAIVDELDRNGDRMISWMEILGTDLLVRARNLSRVLSGIPPVPGPEIGSDDKLVRRTRAFQKIVRRTVKFQRSELPLPDISSAERSGDPVAFLNGAR